MSFEPRETQGEAHLNDYLRMLWKHRWLLTAVFLLTAVTGAIWTLAQTPIYQASATVLIEPELPKILNIQEITNPGMGSLEYYRTQYALMTSRPVMENTVAALKRQGRSAALAALGAGTDPRVKHLGVVSVEPIRNTQLVLVRFEHSDPVLAAEVATTVAQAYVKYNLDSKLKGSRDALVWLNEQMSSLKTKVEESSVALQNYRVKAGILGIQEQRVLTAQKAQEVNRSHLDAQARRLSIESKLRELSRIAKEQASTDSLTTSIEEPLIGKLKAEMAELQNQRSKLLQTYKDKHPEVLKVDAQIQQLAQRMDAEIQKSLRALDTEYKVARAREDSLMGAVNRLRSEGQELNEKEIEYSALQREADSNQQLYEAMLKRLKETGVAGGLDTNNARVVEEASAPGIPVRPRKTFGLMMSVLLGLGLGVAAVVGVEYFDRSVKSPEDVERVLGLPVIAVVPAFASRH